MSVAGLLCSLPKVSKVRGWDALRLSIGRGSIAIGMEEKHRRMLINYRVVPLSH